MQPHLGERYDLSLGCVTCRRVGVRDSAAAVLTCLAGEEGVKYVFRKWPASDLRASCVWLEGRLGKKCKHVL